MTYTNDEGDVASVLEAFQDQMRSIAKAQQQRVRLTGTATSRDKMVTVTVNANGVVIETKFHAGISDLSYDQIAKLVTKTAQDAAADVARKNQELAAPLIDKRARLPKLTELIDGLPDFPSEIPVEPPVSLAAPGSPERAAAEDESAALRFRDVEDYNHEVRSPGGRGVTDSSW